MAKMWAGRTDGVVNQLADDFNSSIHFDKKLYKQDIKGSMAHAAMLSACNIISEKEKDEIIDGLQTILNDLESGKLLFDLNCEDIHMFVEQELTNRIGEAGKKLHTARSRNDQVALDMRLYLKDETESIKSQLITLVKTLTDKADAYKDCIMPGYTHLQRAQPVSFAHHLLAYAMMFLRDIDRLNDCKKRIDISPIGCCALAGTTYNTDRRYEAKLLGMSDICLNSLDGVSDRDFCVELLSDLALVMMHLSRFCEEIVLWTSWEFKFVELSDDYTTGSSIMPQKKNSDMAELIRGKTGRVYGDLIALLTVLKGLPLAYNKDMQEDKESVFDAVDTINKCLPVMNGMISTMTVLKDNMRLAAQKGFINATDLADYMVKKGMPFRTAYKISGSIVGDCIKNGKVLEDLTIEEYKQYDNIFENDVFQAINLDNCMNKRISEGGTSKESVAAQIEYINNLL